MIACPWVTDPQRKTSPALYTLARLLGDLSAIRRGLRR